MTNKTIDKILDSFNIRHDIEMLQPIPNSVIFASAFLSASAVIQFIVDMCIELIAYLNLIPKIPLRIDFISLTTISAFLAYQTLTGLRRRELDVTENSLKLGFLVESALIIGDLVYLYSNPVQYYISLRIPFLFFTSVNLTLITYIWVMVIQHGHKFVYYKRRKSDKQQETSNLAFTNVEKSGII
jgi:hypothetical protein